MLRIRLVSHQQASGRIGEYLNVIRVTFHLGSVTGEHTASVSGAGDVMSGAATWDFRPGNDIVLKGRFVAERK